jgi:hypothetical protein
MKTSERISKLEAMTYDEEVIEFIFKSIEESESDAIERGKLKFPKATKFIIVSWISPNQK